MTRLQLTVIEAEKHARCGECELRGEHDKDGFCPGTLPEQWEHGGLMVVGEGPGVSEMRVKQPFIGRSGQLLDALLKSAGIAREDVAVSNATLCLPPRIETEGNFTERHPTAVPSCLPRLEYEIALARPRVIVALGAAALLSLTGVEHERAVRENFACPTCDPLVAAGTIKARAKTCPTCKGLKTRAVLKREFKMEHTISWVAGAVIRTEGTWLADYGVKYVVPTYHPSYLLRKAETAAQKAMGGQFCAPATVAHLRKAKRLLTHDAKWSLAPIVTDMVEDVEKLIAEADPSFPYAIDIETDAKEPFEVTTIRCIGIGRADKPEVYVFDTSGSAPNSPLVQALVRFLADVRVPKVLQNRAYDEVVIDRIWNCVVQGTVGDTLLAHHALFPDELHNLHQIAFRYTDTAPWKPPKNRNGMAQFGSDDEFHLYNARDVRATALAWVDLAAEMDAERVRQVHDMDMRMTTIAMDMQIAGMPLDRAKLKELGDEKAAVAAMSLGSMRDVAGPEFNPASSQQLQAVLFGTLGLRAGAMTKTGQAGTSRTALRHLLDHSFVRALFDYRDAQKIVSTYCTPYLALGSDRIHTIWKVFGTHTGRWSSSPNLQNWPRDLRTCIVAPPGYKLVGADYAALEFRILAALCGDAKMIELISRADESKKLYPEFDPHSFVASIAFGRAFLDADPTTKEGKAKRKALREIAKRVVYATSYGAGARKIQENIMSDEDYTGPPLTIDMVQRVLQAYFKAFPRVQPYMQATIQLAQKTGQVISPILGRKRDFPLGDADVTVAQNHAIQSGAADIVDAALDRLYVRLSAESPDSAIIAQVHDAIYVEAPDADATNVARIVEECLYTELALVPGATPTPFTAAAKVGQDWASVS